MSNNKSNDICQCFSLCLGINKMDEQSVSREINSSAKWRPWEGVPPPLIDHSRVNCSVTLFSLPLMPCRDMFVAVW